MSFHHTGDLAGRSGGRQGWFFEHRREPPPHPAGFHHFVGEIRNLLVDNFLCHTNGRIIINGAPGNPVAQIQLRGAQLHMRDVHDPRPGGREAWGAQF